MKKQTAGQDAIGEFASKFAELNDDVLFGQVWSREDQLSLRDRSIITVTALMTKGIFDNSLKYHITNAKNHGVSAEKNVRNHHTSCILRRMAECMGSVCIGERSIC